MITEQHQQECLSRSYIQAVTGITGVNLVPGREFDYGFDGTFRQVEIRGTRRVESSFPLDFQLKCTRNWTYEKDQVAYNIETKTFNDLVTRDPLGTGAILILLCLPKAPSDWIEISEDYMKIQKCCYYAKLAGPVVENENSTKKIHIPRANILTGESLKFALGEERSRRIGSTT